MKYFILIISVLIIFFSCEYSQKPVIVLSDYPMPDYSDFKIPELEKNLEKTLNKKQYIARFVYNNIIWKSDQDVYGEEFFQSAIITWKKKQGDCDDMAILFLVLCQLYLQEEGIAVSAKSYQNNNNHMMAKIDDDYYFRIDHYFNNENNVQINRIYNYEKIVKISEYCPSIKKFIIIG